MSTERRGERRGREGRECQRIHSPYYEKTLTKKSTIHIVKNYFLLSKPPQRSDFKSSLAKGSNCNRNCIQPFPLSSTHWLLPFYSDKQSPAKLARGNLSKAEWGPELLKSHVLICLKGRSRIIWENQRTECCFMLFSVPQLDFLACFTTDSSHVVF